MEGRKSLAELAGQLKEKVQKDKIVAVESEVKQTQSLEEYFSAAEQYISTDKNLDGKTLTHWVDGCALVLGKNLAKESLATPEGKSVAEGLRELVAIENEIEESKAILQQAADVDGVSIEKLLSDPDNELAQAIVELQQEKTAQTADLQSELRAFTLGVVQTLQESNRRKLGMSKEELAEWNTKFQEIEAIPQDYKSFTAKLQQDFVTPKVAAVDRRVSAHEKRIESKEHARALKERVWTDYTQRLIDIIAEELPGDENEEKRRHILAGLLDKSNDNLLRVAPDLTAVIIKDEVLDALSETAFAEIAKQSIIAATVTAFEFQDISQLRSNREAYINCLAMLNVIDDQSAWAEATSGGTFIGTRAVVSAQLRDKAALERAGSEIALANEIDAVTKFFYDGLTRSQQNDITHGQNDYRVLSPVWRTLSNNPPTFKSDIPASVTPDGVFYSSIDSPEANRTSMQRATVDARTFVQGLSDTLNRGKLNSERKAVTPADVEARNSDRVFAAEQQALAAQGEVERSSKEVGRVSKEKATVEKELREQLRGKESDVEEKTKRIAALEKELKDAREFMGNKIVKLDAEIVTLNGENGALAEKVKQSERKATILNNEKNALVAKLREAAEKPGMFGGDLKKAVADLLNEESPEKN